MKKGEEHYQCDTAQNEHGLRKKVLTLGKELEILKA